VRDCSCRGTSGFAHLSCMITNAHHLGEQAAKENGSHFALSKCFQVCTNCKQQYQNNLYYDMMKALIVFVDKEFEGIENGDLHVCSRRDVIRVVDVEKEQDRAEGEAMISKLLSILEEMKQSSDHWDMEGRDAKMEALAYNAISRFYKMIGTEEALNTAKLYEEKARDLYRQAGDEYEARTAEMNIAAIEIELSGDESKLDKLFDMDYLRGRYECLLEELGETDTQTIDAGVTFANMLADECHTIEAERLLSRLVATSRRVHGPDHSCTVYAASVIRNWCSVRGVVVQGEGERFFQALRYENDGEKCVVQGSFLADGSRNKSEEKILIVPSTDIIPAPGMPVICHGLEGDEAHLNGKLGEGREFSRENDKFMIHVHFEEEGLEPAKIEPKNLRIVFDLP
jgi:hypothetical protein